jgi:transglutaminase-like putative cysteine protease
MGIPTRVASGLVFMKNFKNEKNILGFHMWTEFLLKGKWVPLDSALKKLGAHPDRITLGVSSLDENSITEVGVGISEMVGNLSVKIEKIEFK